MGFPVEEDPRRAGEAPQGERQQRSDWLPLSEGQQPSLQGHHFHPFSSTFIRFIYFHPFCPLSSNIWSCLEGANVVKIGMVESHKMEKWLTN